MRCLKRRLRLLIKNKKQRISVTILCVEHQHLFDFYFIFPSIGQTNNKDLIVGHDHNLLTNRKKIDIVLHYYPINNLDSQSIVVLI